MSDFTIDRRSLLAAVAKVSVVATFPVTFGGFQAAQASQEKADALYWVAINSDNSVTLTIPQSEIGQAVTTTMSMSGRRHSAACLRTTFLTRPE